MENKWIIGEPDGPAGPFYSIVSQSGEIIAMQIASHERAKEIVDAHNLKPGYDLMAHECEMALHDFITQDAIIEELRLLADNMSTHKALADKIGISSQYLCDILKGKRNPGVKVCEFLKVKSVFGYQEIKG